MNLLKNGSFEGITRPGGWTRKTHTGEEWGEIYTPEGWTAWWEEGEYRRPEMKVIQRVSPFLDPARVYDGDWAVQAFTMYGRMNAGYYQEVSNLEPGATYRLSAYAHAWSNHDGMPNNNDAHCSAGVGRGPFFCMEDDVPPENGDSWNDAIGNFTFRVGVSTFPHDFYDDDTFWGKGACIYNGYSQVPSLRFIAREETLFMLLKAVSLWKFRNSDAYWDKVVLEKIADPSPEPPQGLPREQYKRTYVLMNPTAEKAQVNAVNSATWEMARYTVGGSADDSGIGALDWKRAIALNPEEWSGDLAEFFDEHYPGTKQTFIEYDNNYQLEGRMLAVVLGDLGLKLAYPLTRSDYHVTSPFGEDRIAYMHNGLDLRASYNVWGDKVLAAIGGKVINAGHYTTAPYWGHYVRTRTTLPSGHTIFVRYAHLLPDVLVSTGDEVTVGQEIGLPDNTGNSSGDHLHIDVAIKDKDGIPYADPEMLIDFPDGEEPPTPIPPTYHNLLGLHLQTWYNGVDNYVCDAKPSVMKVFSPHDAVRVKQLNPDTLTVVRFFTTEQHLSGSDQEIKDRIQNYVNGIAPDLVAMQGSIDYVESWNETIGSSDYEGNRRAVVADCAFAQSLHNLGVNVKPALLCVAVGNPLEVWVEQLRPAVEIVCNLGGCLSYHPYWWSNRTTDGLISWWQWHAGRWQEWDKVFNTWGLYPHYIFGEMGVVASENGYHLGPHDGWKSPVCLNGDWNKFLVQIEEFHNRLHLWNSTHGNRALGATFFTTGEDYTGWLNFQIREAEMISLAERFG